MAVRIERGNFEDARLVRERVFVEEQGFENEFDETDADPSTIHLTLYADGRLAGCARTFPDPDDPNAEGSTAPLVAMQDGAAARACWVFGRLAVLPEARRGGFGTLLLAEAERVARERGAASMRLHAQCRAAGFYERAGYEQYGPVELDEHVEHVWMRKPL